MKATVHLQGVKVERKGKRQKKTINFAALALRESEQFNRNSQEQENAEVFNFFFVFLIDIKQISSINN